MCATCARHALSRDIEQRMTSIIALLRNALIREVEAMNRSQNALWAYSKDIESLFGREKRTHTQLRQYAGSAKSKCYVRFYNGQVKRALHVIRKQSDENAT